MAFSTGIGDRSGLRSPREEQSSFAGLGLTSPLRSTFGSQAASSNASDVRGQLHRRFTTNNIPTVNTPLSPIGQQRRQAAEPQEFTTAVRSRPLWCQKLVPRGAAACGSVLCALVCSMCMACRDCDPALDFYATRQSEMKEKQG
jgi:hypothetical protein